MQPEPELGRLVMRLVPLLWRREGEESVYLELRLRLALQGFSV